MKKGERKQFRSACTNMQFLRWLNAGRHIAVRYIGRSPNHRNRGMVR